MLEEMEGDLGHKSDRKVLRKPRGNGFGGGLRGLRRREDMDVELGKSETIELMKREIDTSGGLDRAATGYISKRSIKKSKLHKEVDPQAQVPGSGNESQEHDGG